MGKGRPAGRSALADHPRRRMQMARHLGLTVCQVAARFVAQDQRADDQASCCAAPRHALTGGSRDHGCRQSTPNPPHASHQAVNVSRSLIGRAAPTPCDHARCRPARSRVAARIGIDDPLPSWMQRCRGVIGRQHGCRSGQRTSPFPDADRPRSAWLHPGQ
jgi:hypothetical protein